MTQMQDALNGIITDEIKLVAEMERVRVYKIVKVLASGRIIPKNVGIKSISLGIGKGLETKINANVGSSSELDTVEWKVKKAKTPVKYGDDTIMDISTGSKYEKVMKSMKVPIGTVPIYGAGITALKIKGEVIRISGQAREHGIQVMVEGSGHVQIN